jgi:Zn-dependent protease with chaperone function
MPINIEAERAKLAETKCQYAVWELLRIACLCCSAGAALVGAIAFFALVAMGATSWSLHARWPAGAYVIWIVALGNGIAFGWVMGQWARHCENRASDLQAECDRQDQELRRMARQPPPLHELLAIWVERNATAHQAELQKLEAFYQSIPKPPPILVVYLLRRLFQSLTRKCP